MHIIDYRHVSVPGIVRSAGELTAGDLLVHVAAPAPHHGRLGTSRARS